MNVDRIRQAFRHRVDQLQDRDPTLAKKELMRRMGLARGHDRPVASKTFDNLYYDRADKKSFTTEILRAASRAVEWPEEALEKIETGYADADDMPDVPFVEEGDDTDVRLDRVETENREIRQELAEIRKLVEQLVDPDARGPRGAAP